MCVDVVQPLISLAIAGEIQHYILHIYWIHIHTEACSTTDKQQRGGALNFTVLHCTALCFTVLTSLATAKPLFSLYEASGSNRIVAPHVPPRGILSGSYVPANRANRVHASKIDKLFRI